MELRDLPSVETLLAALRLEFPALPHGLLKAEAQQAVARARAAIKSGTDHSFPIFDASARLRALQQPSLRGVVNATGVILHTNLGRAPLPAFHAIEGYSNLEYDLASGRRGKRDNHAGPLLERLTGFRPVTNYRDGVAKFVAWYRDYYGK